MPKSDAREEEGNAENIRRERTDERREKDARLRQIVHDDAVREESRRGDEDDGAVDRPTHAHGEDGVDIFRLQFLLDGHFAFDVKLLALHDFRVEEEIVRHDASPPARGPLPP